MFRTIEADIPVAVERSDVDKGSSPAVPAISVLACAISPIAVPTIAIRTHVSAANHPNSARLAVISDVSGDKRQESRPKYAAEPTKTIAIMLVIIETSDAKTICGTPCAVASESPANTARQRTNHVRKARRSFIRFARHA